MLHIKEQSNGINLRKRHRVSRRVVSLFTWLSIQ